MRKRKGKTYEEICGKEKAQKWKENLGKAHIKNKFKDDFNSIRNNISYIFGVLYGDAYSHYNENQGVYFIGLETKDEDFAKEFKENLQEISTKKDIKITIRNREYKHTTIYGNKFDCKSKIYKVVLNSKEITSYFIKNKEKFLKNISDEKEVAHFLRGFIDSEGHTTFDKNNLRHIGITNKDLYLLNKIKDFLIILGFDKEKIKIYSKKWKSLKFYQIWITSRQNLYLFREKIGFSIKWKRIKLDNILDIKRISIPNRTKEINELNSIMKELREKGNTYQEISNRLNVGYGTIHSRLNGREFNGTISKW